MSRSVSSSSAQALRDFPVPVRQKGVGAAAFLSGKAPSTPAVSPVISPAVTAAATTLCAQDIAALSKARSERWQPGLTDQPLHSEIFASTGNASGAGLALALARDALEVAGRCDDPLAETQDRRQVLWVQERRAIQRSGRPYLHGLPRDWRDRLIHVEAASAQDALFALEEGLQCRELACVIGEIVGNPRALNFTASRRLSLTAQKHGVALWLVRLEAEVDLSSARMRWRVEPAASQHSRWNSDAPGDPAWRAELFRARSHAPGKWVLSNEEGRLSAHIPQQRERPSAPIQDIGPAFAAQIKARRRRSHSQPRGQVNTASINTASIKTGAPDHGDLVCPTFGRSLAAWARG